MKSLKLASDLVKKVDEYHGKGPTKAGAKSGPSGPEMHKARTENTLHHSDVSELQYVLCPSCHAHLRKHIAAKAIKAAK